jgi:hypothetical protein
MRNLCQSFIVLLLVFGLDVLGVLLLAFALRLRRIFCFAWTLLHAKEHQFFLPYLVDDFSC